MSKGAAYVYIGHRCLIDHRHNVFLFNQINIKQIYNTIH